MLDAGANVNFYMFYGGTNFGFTAGANDGKYTEQLEFVSKWIRFRKQMTSFDTFYAFSFFFFFIWIKAERVNFKLI